MRNFFAIFSLLLAVNAFSQINNPRAWAEWEATQAKVKGFLESVEISEELMPRLDANIQALEGVISKIRSIVDEEKENNKGKKC